LDKQRLGFVGKTSLVKKKKEIDGGFHNKTKIKKEKGKSRVGSINYRFGSGRT